MASKEQKEGVVRVFDTLTASAVIGVVVGLAGYGAIIYRDIVLLAVATPVMLAFSWSLRRVSK